MTSQHTERFSVISDGLPSQTPDVDPEETAEWLESLDAVLEKAGRGRARYLMLKMLERAREKNVGVPALRSTDYVNTIPASREPDFPGDEHIERRIRAYVRWNAAIMVSRANRPEIGVGGHIATYASAASRSSSEPAPSSSTATPAVACGTKTCSSPSPPASRAKERQWPVRSWTTSRSPVRTSSTVVRTGPP